MPSAEASAFRSQYRQSSASEASSPSRGSISAPHMPQQTAVAAPPLPQSSGTMSIGSIIEPNMHGSSYDAHAGGHSLHEMSHPIGTTHHTLLPELLYGLSPSGDSLYSSSDSCYSPISDYLQPQALPQPYYPQEVIRRPQSASLEACFQPIIQQPPISAGPSPPTWNEFDPSGMGFASEAHLMPPVSGRSHLHSLTELTKSSLQRQYAYHSPSWPGAQPIPPYEMNMHFQQSGQWTKVNF